ncbi:MAG: MFS transporter [Candidatus Heimdallarchaeota archaeon]|nr:MFS transporter [Candidatus Heimdallarchaeota archaeon]
MKRETQTLFGLMLSSFIVNLGFGAIMPFLSLYANHFFEPWDWGFTTVGVVTQIGLLTSAMMISRAFLAPFFGKMSDKAGRKPVIVVGLTMYVFLTFGFGLARAFWSLFLVRFFQGIASALVWPVAESAVVDISPNDKRGRNIGWFMLSMTLGWSVGPFMGGGLFALVESLIGLDLVKFAGMSLLALPAAVGSGSFNLFDTLHNNLFPTIDLVGNAEVLSFQITFFLMGGLSLLAVILFNFLVIDPKTKKAKMSLKELWIAILEVIKSFFKIRIGIPAFFKPSFWKERTVSLRALFVMAFSNGFSFAMIFPILSLFLAQFYGMSTELIGTVFGIAGIAGVTFNPIGGYLADKSSKKLLVIVSGVVSALLLATLGFQMVLWVLIALFITRQMFQQINMPAFRALQADLVKPETRGLEFGNVQLFHNFGSVFGPILGGILYDVFSKVSWSIGTVTVFGVEIIMIITSSIMIFAVIIVGIFVKKEDMVLNGLPSVVNVREQPIILAEQD